MNLIRREPRTPVLNPAFEPFSLMRNLVRWDPFRDFDYQTEPSAFMPSFDIKETAEGYAFVADMPGIRQEDLDINLTGNRLSITGKRERDSKTEGESFFISERSFGSFARTFSLPEGVDGNRVNAELKNGVLTLSVPKVPEVQPKKITIQG